MVRLSTIAVTMFLLLPSMVSGKLLSEDEKAEMLNLHNQKRCMAGVPALTWDDKLAKDASDYVDTAPGAVHSTALGAFKTYGECIQGACPDDDPAKAMKFWYGELPKYTESSPFQASHYTQVVWKATTKVGCGVGPSTGLCSGGKVYVCQYTPVGNQFGKYADNVIAPNKDESQCPLPASSATASDAGDDDNAAPSDAGDDDKEMTHKGCPCKSKCGKGPGAMAWCWVADSCKTVAGTSEGSGYGLCTPGVKPVVTKDGCQCREACTKNGESYTWCHTADSCGGQPADSAWDYCSPSRLYDETTSPIMARFIPGMALPALAMLACALLAFGAVAVRCRAKPANCEQVRGLMGVAEEEEKATTLE
jgi:hypothetical protein